MSSSLRKVNSIFTWQSYMQNKSRSFSPDCNLLLPATRGQQRAPSGGCFLGTCSGCCWLCYKLLLSCQPSQSPQPEPKTHVRDVSHTTVLWPNYALHPKLNCGNCEKFTGKLSLPIHFSEFHCNTLWLLRQRAKNRTETALLGHPPPMYLSVYTDRYMGGGGHC